MPPTRQSRGTLRRQEALQKYEGKESLMTTEEIKGLVFLLLMIPVGIRYFIKTGNNDLSLNKVDYAIAAGIVVVIVLINL